ncbi:hypothetical protein MKW98_011188 [Papaver atlanticum]|uniref:Pentatricopeptide repeat-containing protein n=1 Tax=Papaver atlanticum TaxID=357466 RepID=A0AAD4S2X0_9MAGN|nr:hypothetical protein MKW98_011188 [Papaver atlanticum]
MSYKDVVSWTCIISAYVKDGSYREALDLFHNMIKLSEVPNEFTYSSVLRSCSSLFEFELGICTHAQIIKRGFEPNLVLGSALIDFYSKCGYFEESLKIFDIKNSGDTVSWTTMISSLVQSQNWIQSLKLYLRMIEGGVSPNGFTFVKLLMACSILGMKYGKLVHAHIVLMGIELNLIMKTALAEMYSKCQRMEEAAKVLNQTPESDVWLWTALITGYARVSNFGKVISSFREMQFKRILPNSFTYAGILNTSASIHAWELGKQIHSLVIKDGLETSVSVGNALVDMYMKSSAVVRDALGAFEEIISPNVVSWTSLITGFTQRGLKGEAFQAFMDMQVFGLQPNPITVTEILKSCSSNEVRNLHGYVIKSELRNNVIVGNALVDVYARFGSVGDAWNVLKGMPHRDVVTYTNFAAGLNQMGDHQTTLSIISNIYKDQLKMDGHSMATFLSASASLAATETGKQLHCHSVKSGLGSWISVSNALVDLYGKCGNVNDCQRAFSEILVPNVVSWNVLISGLASNGDFSSALSIFEDMILAAVKPDHITMLLVLYTCSHGGLINRGIEYFNSMTKTHGIKPTIDHCICLVDLLGRAGRLEEAMSVIENMKPAQDALIYKTLLASCKVHGNVTMGEDMARRALQLNPSDPAVYVLLANIYDDAGKTNFGDLTRQLMRDNGLRKNPGKSWLKTSRCKKSSSTPQNITKRFQDRKRSCKLRGILELIRRLI